MCSFTPCVHLHHVFIYISSYSFTYFSRGYSLKIHFSFLVLLVQVFTWCRDSPFSGCLLRHNLDLSVCLLLVGSRNPSRPAEKLTRFFSMTINQGWLNSVKLFFRSYTARLETRLTEQHAYQAVSVKHEFKRRTDYCPNKRLVCTMQPELRFVNSLCETW